MLAKDAPSKQHITEFYLWISFGGMLGGIFNAFVAPAIFLQVTEYKLVSALALLALPLLTKNKISGEVFSKNIALILLMTIICAGIALNFEDMISPETSKILIYFIVIITFLVLMQHGKARVFLVAMLVSYSFISDGKLGDDDLYKGRSFFGSYKVVFNEEDGIRNLFHGTTLHGGQLQDPSRKLEPVYYYHREGPLGQLIDYLGEDYLNNHSVAVTGLGVGTIGCLFETKQRITYYEIDPMVADIAQNTDYFTHLRDCSPNTSIVIGDARIKMKYTQDQSYKLIMLDAFSSDSIPIHLLTREAIELYLSKLKEDGLLVIHISNRHLDLKPIIASFSDDLNLEGLVNYYRPQNKTATKKASEWVVLSRNSEILKPLKQAENRWDDIQDFNDKSQIWTDDYSSILNIFKF